AGLIAIRISCDLITDLWRALPTMRRPIQREESMRIFVVLACLVGLAISASVADAAAPPAGLTNAVSAFRADQPTEAASTAPDITVSCKRYPNRKYNCIARLASDGSQVTHCWYYKKLTAANREACRQKALTDLGFFKAPAAKAANKVPASY